MSLRLGAGPVGGDGADSDGGRCSRRHRQLSRTSANPEQEDADRDGVGDACDDCAETNAGDPVLRSGCSPAQRAHATAPSETRGVVERSGAYMQCIARSLKILSERKQVSRSRVRELIQEAYAPAAAAASWR